MLRKALIAPGLWLAALLVVAGCSDGSDRPRNSVDPYLPIADPAVADPPSEGSFFLQLANFDLAEVGYRSREFFVSGTATAFTNLEELAADGLWTAEPAETADFRTRIVVVRPENSADFSGTVQEVYFDGDEGAL